MTLAMKMHNYLAPSLAVGLVAFSTGAKAEQDVTNRFSLSARVGFNISARFKGVANLAAPMSVRRTPDGALYNYDDGYVLTDLSGNFGGQTWNWGYDDSTRQVAGNTILLHRDSGSASLSSPDLDLNPLALGVELAYSRQLGVKGSLHYGVGIAANYLNFELRDSSSASANVTRLTDAYPFDAGTTPPEASPSAPYQGTFNGPGFVIGDTSVSSSTAVIPGVFLQDQRRFNADLWGLHLGPYLELPLGKAFNVSLSAGVAVGLLDSAASWTQTLSVSGGGSTSLSGSGHDTAFMWGGYVGANLSWQFYDRWSAVGGVQYQNLGTYQHSFGGRQVEVDLRNSIFVTLGLGYSF